MITNEQLRKLGFKEVILDDEVERNKQEATQ